MDRPRTATAALALLLALSAIATLGTLPVAADADDSATTGPWLEDGSVVRDRVRLSADDPSADPVDWFRVNLTAGASQLDLLRIYVNMTRNSGPQYFVWASILDPDGALLTEVKTAGFPPRSTGTLCHRTGVYLIRVYTNSYFDCHYRLEVSIERRANVTDGDDTLAEATFLEPPAHAEGHLHGIMDPFDHYAVNITRDSTHYEFVEVRLAPNGTGVGQRDLDLFLILVDDEGNLDEAAASTTNGSTEVAFLAAQESFQTVYIRCHAYGGDTDYTLDVVRYRVPDDGNNNILRATWVEPGDVIDDGLNVTDRLDYFQLDLLGGDLLKVFVQTQEWDPVNRVPDINIYLYDPEGRIINWSHSYDPLERVGWEVPMGEAEETYYFLVTFFDRDPYDAFPAWGNYTLNVTVDHAPRLLGDLPLVVPEDGQLTIAVGDLVEDPEGELASASPGEAAHLVVQRDGDDLVIAPVANFSGLTSFPLEVRDARRTLTLHVPVDVTPSPDAPAAVDPLPALETDEDTELVLQLMDLVVDGDGDVLAFALETPEGTPMAGSRLVGSTLTVVPAPDFFGTATVTVNASDGTGLWSLVELPVQVLPVPDPPRALSPVLEVTAEEDQLGIEVDLTTVLLDPDGEGLTYIIPVAEHARFIVVGDTLVVDPEEDFSGTVDLMVTARDAGGAEATATVRLTLAPIDDPPRVSSRDPAGRPRVSEGEAQVFVVGATDPEGKVLSYSWFLDGAPVPGETLSRLELVTNWSSHGVLLVSVRVSDGSEVTWVNWSLTVDNVNRAPTLTVQRPRDGAQFDEGENIVFEAVAEDPDGEGLSVQWLVGEEVIGTGKAFTTSGLRVGTHRVTVRATDPHGSVVEATLKVEVKEPSGIPGVWGPVAAIAVVLAAVLGAAWYRSRRT